MNKYNNPFWVVFLMYIAVNGALILSVESGVHLTEGADAGSWYGPALALLKHGSFVMLDSPETLMTYRAPLYPLYEAIMLWIGNGEILSIIVGQIILLWITGIFAGRIVSLFIPKYEIIALSLVIFNPSALGVAHLIQSDTLYALFIILSVWGLVRYMLSNNKLKWSVITGMFLGVSCLIRPTGQYLIFLLPIIFILINILYGYKNILKESIVHGVVGAIISGVVLAPWIIHNEEAGWGYVLVPSSIKTIYLHDNTKWAEKKYRNISMNDATVSVNNSELMYINSRGEKWENMSNKERSDELVMYYETKLMSYPAHVLLGAYIDSWIDFFGGGGSVNFHNLLSIDTVTAMEKNITGFYPSRLEVIFDSLSDAPMQAILISTVSYVYVLILRLLGLFGIIEMIKRGEYSLLLIVTGLITYFAMTSLFVGNSRYRLPVEIGFIVLALYGLLFVKKYQKIKA